MDLSLFNNITARLHQYLGIPLYVIGNLSNIICVMIFIRKTWRKNVCVFYFLTCLFFDCMNVNVSLLGSIVILGFNIDLTRSNVALCKIYNYLSLLLSTLSATILILASIDRLLISSQNIDTRLYSSRRLAYLLISVSTTLWSIFFIHILIQFDIQRIGFFASICLFDVMAIYADFIAYSMLIIDVVAFFLMIVLLTLSFKNVRRIRSIPRRQRQIGRTMHKKDFQLLRCLFAKDILYIVFNTFLCFYLIYKSIRKSQTQTIGQQQLDVFAFNLGYLIHQIPFCVSLYTYSLISRAFRQDFKRLVWKMIGKNNTVVTPEEGEQNEQEARRRARESIAISTIIS